MRVEKYNTPKNSFKGFYEITTTVQENTLLNRGLLDIGGCAIPQAIMSNNKDEAIERLTGSGLYFAMSICSPFLMLPFLNKHFLKSNGIVKDFKGLEKHIMQVSKEYLTKDGKYLAEGIRETAIELDKKKKGNGKCHQAFENILKRFKGNEDELKEKLINVHKNVLKYDFLSTAWFGCAVPYIATGLTEKRTHKKGFSAAFDMVGQQNVDDKKYEREKRYKMLTSAMIATVFPLITPKLLMNSITKGGLKKYASLFNYTDGKFLSKAIYALTWALCDYPSSLVSARDKLERRDRAIRNSALFVMFFGGDFAINNLAGRFLDKYTGTKIMLRAEISPNLKGKERIKQFFKDFRLLPRDFSKLDNIMASPEVIHKTRKYGSALYWFSLLSNMALIGFGLPAVLNRMLRNTIKRDNMASQNLYKQQLDKKSFAKMGF